MRSVIAGFLMTLALVALDVAPPPEALQGSGSQSERAMAARHGGESDAALRDELGLDAR